MGTGGGPPHKSLSPLAEAVQSVLSEDSEVISGIEGGIDSSLISLLQPNEDVCTISTIQLVNETPRSSIPTFGTATQLLPLSPNIPSPSSPILVRSCTMIYNILVLYSIIIINIFSYKIVLLIGKGYMPVFAYIVEDSTNSDHLASFSRRHTNFSMQDVKTTF
ncbi:hypothetical protein ScPMuIL_005427 [Solemya velum]